MSERSHAPAVLTCVAQKFGGSSLADAACFRRVAAIVAARMEPRQLVIVSAMRGVTDALIALAAAAARREPTWHEQWEALRRKHLDTAAELGGEAASSTAAWLEAELESLRELLKALGVLGTLVTEALEAIQGLGEVWSSALLASLLGGAAQGWGRLDAREVLVVRHDDLGVAIDWEASASRLASWRAAQAAPKLVVTGFVARTPEGRPTVLGRNGSDYSASIFAVLGGADELTIWGDTDGVLSADPRLVPEAVSLPSLSYNEACELAYFGAKIIHPQTMTPAISRKLPVRIRNTFRPEHPGTVVGESGLASPSSGMVKGASIINGLAIVDLQGAGMLGVLGTAERTFGALRAAKVSVVMISQGSSEHSICCVVRESDAERALAALREAFAVELSRGSVQGVEVATGISVLAVVGDEMAGRPGAAARLFGALAGGRVNVRAIAQGSSERNISVALASIDAARALRAAHAAFWLSPQTVSVGLLGPGKVGAALIDQLAAARPRLLAEANIDLRLRAVANSRAMWLDAKGQSSVGWREGLAAGPDFDAIAFTEHVHAEHLPYAVMIDCTASDAVASLYPRWLAAGIHVVTPNKHAGAGSLERWHAIRAAMAQSGARWLYEATVGAALPVIQTLRDLVDTGDEIIAIDGIFSGTLAWLFNRYDGSTPFSTLVREAHALGYTEPDPRDDLSGMDVVRKLTILAREAGLPIDATEVRVESLIAAPLAGVSREAFFARLGELDGPMADRHQRATAAGRVLRYVAHLDPSQRRAHVALTELPSDHAFAHLRLTDNVVQFSTRRYAENPLVVQGPGAGPEVTAAGVFADLLRIATGLSTRR